MIRHARSELPDGGFRSLGEFLIATRTAAEHGKAHLDPRLVRAANEADVTAGGFAVPEVYAVRVIGSIYEGSVLAPLCDVTETSGPLANYKEPAFDETSRVDGSRWGGALGYWLAESANVPPTRPRFRMNEYAPNKLILIAQVTNEMFRDANMLESHFERAMAAEGAFKLDAAVFSGSGAGQPLGILAAPATITVAKASGQTAGTIVAQNVTDMWSRVPLASRRRAVWLVNEDAEGQLASFRTDMYLPQGVGGNAFPLLNGRPLIAIEQASQLGTVGDIVLADPLNALVTIAQALNKIPDPARKARDEVELFGRSGQDLNAMLDNLSEGMDALAKKSSDAGQMMSPGLTKQAKDADIQMDAFATTLKTTVSEAIVGTIQDIQYLGIAIRDLPPWHDMIAGPFSDQDRGIKPPAKAQPKPQFGPTPEQLDKEMIANFAKPDIPAPTIIDEDQANREAQQARRLADQITQINQQTAERRIQTEEQTNEHLLSMGEESLAQWRAQAEKLENDRYQIALDGLKKREAADAGDKAALAKDKADEEQIEVEHQGRLAAIQDQYEEKNRQRLQQEFQDFVKSRNDQLDAAINALNQEEKFSAITAQQKNDQEVALTQAIEAEVLARFDAEHAGLDKGTTAYAEAMKQRQALVDSFTKHITQANDQLAESTLQSWKSILAPIEQGFNGMIQALVSGQQRLGTTAKQMLANMVVSYAEARVKIEFDWLAGQLAMALGAQKWADTSLLAWIAAQLGITTAQTTAATTGPAVSAAASTTEVLQAAAVGYANAYAATAAIPIVGPELAPGVAAATYASIASMSVASAAGGQYLVPINNQLTLLHANEQVLPAPYASGLRNLIANNQTGGAAVAAPQISPTLNVSAIDSRSFLAFLNNPASMRILASRLSAAMNLNPSYRPKF